MDNEATQRLNANNIWQLCNTFDDRIDDSSSSGSSTINSCDSGSSNNSNIGGDGQHSDDSSCCSSTDPDGFVYPPSNHSSPTVVGVAIKRSLKVTESDLEPTQRIAMPKMTMPTTNNNNINRAVDEMMIMVQKEATAAPPNVLVDCSAPIVDLDANEIDERANDAEDENEGVDVFYECNNNYTLKNVALYDAKRTVCVAAVDLISNGNHVDVVVGGPKPQPNLIDSDSLTDLFMKKYHAHNELIENNYYCINTKRIEETINLIDLHDDGDVDATMNGALLQPVVIDTRPRTHGPADVIPTSGSVERANHKGPKLNGNSVDHNLHVQQAALAKEASLLDLSDESIGKVVDSLLGDTVCTNHLLADVREDFERLKVNVGALNGHFGSDTIDGRENTPRATSHTSDHNSSFQQRNESDSNQLVNSIINQSDTANSRLKRPHQPTVHFRNNAVGERRQQQQHQQPGRAPPKLNGAEDIVNIIDIDVHGKMFYYMKLFACYFGLSFACFYYFRLSASCSGCVRAYNKP